MPRSFRVKSPLVDSTDIGETVVSRDDVSSDWDPNSIGQAWKPPAVTQFEQATKSSDFIPYRGDEPHGIGYDEFDKGDPRTLPTAAAVGTDAVVKEGSPVVYKVDEDDHRTPLLVEMLDKAPKSFERGYATRSIILNDTNSHAILSKRPNRTKASINVKQATAAIGPSGAIATYLPVTNPAIGTDVSYTLPQAMMMNSIFLTLTTDAVVQARNLVLSITSPTGLLLYRSPDFTTQSQSVAHNFTFLTNVGPNTTSSPNNVFPLPQMVYPAGTVISTTTALLDAGDQISNVSISGTLPAGNIPLRVWLVGVQGGSQLMGYPMDVGDTLVMQTENEVHVSLDPLSAAVGQVIVSVFEEWETEIPWVLVENDTRR